MLNWNETRLYVRGKEENVKEFTIKLSWYHSSYGIIGSVNFMDDGEIVLNLIAEVTKEIYIWELAERCGCYKA